MKKTNTNNTLFNTTYKDRRRLDKKRERTETFGWTILSYVIATIINLIVGLAISGSIL